MATTMTLSGDWLISIGNRYETSGTGNVGTYATGGVAVTANQVGLGTIHNLIIGNAGGYTFEYVASTGKIKAYQLSGFSGHTHDLLIIGSQAATTTNEIGHYATDILGKEAATDATIVGADSATKGGVVAASSAAGAAGDEVTASTNLSGVTFSWRAIGI